MKTKSKEILKVYNTESNQKKLIVDYKCKLCGAVHEKKILADVKSEEIIKSCPNCTIRKLSNIKNHKIICIFAYENIKQKNYISSRLKYDDTLKVRQMLEAFLTINDNYKLLLDKSNTIGLKNPFAKTVWIDDLVIKKIETDKVDRIRYFNPVKRYEYASLSRSMFKTICKNQNFNFNDFSEVDSGEYYTFVGRNDSIKNIRKYNYFFKKGTIEEYYYKKGE